MILILYGILIAHFISYKQYYAKIGMTFAVTFVMKRLIKSVGSKEHADLIGLGGYALTIGEFALLLGAMKESGFKGNSIDANKFLGGFLGNGLDSLKDLGK